MSSPLRSLRLWLVFSFSLAAWAQAPMNEELGALRGAQFRILMPASWNRVLVLWCDGYRPSAGTFQKGKGLGKFALALVEQGYAVAESGYSKGGLAVDQAFVDTHALREHFLAEHSKTRAVYVLGESMGGLVALTLVESYPNSYKAGLSFCGLLASPFEYTRRAFDLLALFHHFHPEALPPPSAIPADFSPSETSFATVAASLDRSPVEAELVRNQAGVNTNEELAQVLVFHTDLLRDLATACGGNAFDNRSTIYVVGARSTTINERLQRVSASPTAIECVKRMKAPRGNLLLPFLAVDSASDPVVPAWFANGYENSLAGTPFGSNFVRQFVSGSGHCPIPLQTRLDAFQDVVNWAGSRAARPNPGLRGQ
jgi:pimeloyl-ACP methyl ester carboxylesterase